MGNPAQARFNELKAKGIILTPAQRVPEYEVDQAIRARAQEYYRNRGMPVLRHDPYSVSRSIGESIDISRGHWPNLKTVPKRLMDEVNYRNRR